VAYNGSWTILPELRGIKSFSRVLRDLSVAMICTYYIESKFSLIFAAAAVRFKVNELKLKMGWLPLVFENSELPNISLKSFFDEQVGIYYLKEWSDFAIEMSRSFFDLWQERVIISKNQIKDSENLVGRIAA